jgi:hypothetical protein
MKILLIRSALAAALTLSLAAPALAAQTLRYVALVDDGKQAGHQTVTLGDDGVTRVDYIFKDNGRGPELKEEFTLAPDGTFATYHVTGSTTFGAPVDESFVREGDRVRWKTTNDQGEQAVNGTAFYTPLSGTPAGNAVALAALAGREDGKLPLIPGGALRMRKVTEMEITRPGEKRTVQLLAVTGVGLTPNFVWATTDAQPRLFATIYPGDLQLI